MNEPSPRQEEEQPTQEQPTDSTAKPKVKKPYVKPAFRMEKVFETNALSCGKIAGTSALCNASRKTS